MVLDHPGLSIKPLTCSVRLHRRDRWSGKRRRSSLYSMILQGAPVFQTLPWCSKCAVTLRDFLHFCSLRLPTWDTKGSNNARKWHFPLHRPSPWIYLLVRSLSFSPPLPPPLPPPSHPLFLSFTHAHTSLYLSTSFRICCFLITLFVFKKEFLISCFNLHVCERVCARARAGGRAGGRAR